MSRFILGLMRLKNRDLSSSELNLFIKKVVELGINTFDLADIYGNYECEAIFGEAIRNDNSLRDEIKIITKCGINLMSDKFPARKVKHYDTGKEHLIKSVDKSLKNLNTDHIDLLLIHRPDPLMNPEEVAQTFKMVKKEGKVLNFGVSNFSPQQFDLLNGFMEDELICNQIEFSPYHIDPITSGEMDFWLSKGINVMSWSPTAGGRLLNADDEKSLRIFNVINQIAKEMDIDNPDKIIYSWILKHPAGIHPVPGTGNLDRIKSAIDSMKINLSREDWFRIYEASLGRAVD